jgi:Ser/Thr protein kinase RdoA (MazF antagonist)
VLVARDAVVGVIDFEDAQVDWLTWDLACAVGTFRDTGDGGACARVVAAYRAAGGGVAPADDDLLLA